MKSDLNFIVMRKNGQTFDMHELGIWVESFHIFSPNIEQNIIGTPGMNGARQISMRMKERNVYIALQIESDNMREFDNLKHKIYDIFYSNEELTIIRDLTPDKEIHVVLEGEYDIDNITGEDGEFELSPIMLDPFIYGLEITEQFTNGALSLTNNGTAETKPIIDITVDVDSSDVVISDGDKTLRIIYDLVIGDTLQIDFIKRKIFINDVLQMTAVDLNNPHFFALKPGMNDLTITPVTSASLIYKEMWR